MTPAAELSAWVRDARVRTLALVADLSDAQLMGPRLAIVNPLRWEVGHIGWFQERWALRGDTRPDEADALYDSSAIPHDTRWDLPLPSRADTVARLAAAQQQLLERIETGSADAYFVRLAVFHEDMHGEAFLYTRQTLAYAAPRLGDGAPPEAGPLPGDVKVPGGVWWLGAFPFDDPFVFDNEKWAHPVSVEPFAIARAPVTQGELAAFVDDGGYTRRELWSDDGWRWREAEDATLPLWWRRGDGGFERRQFDRWVALEPHRPALHVNAHEAEAYCRWAGRRLPTEAEWEAAAAGEPDGDRLAATKRRFPWGDAAPGAHHAALDARHLGCADVAAYPDGDSAFGCRQMIGNVWEWTASPFRPYPGFVEDPYREYSAPWFETNRVLRGGCFATRGRLLRGSWRNFYTPDRRDVWAGFRTCALG